MTDSFIVNLKFSLTLFLWVVLLHLSVIAIVWALSFMLLLKVSLSGLVIISFCYSLQKYSLFKSRDSIAALKIQGECLSVCFAAGGERPVVLGDHNLVIPFAVALNFKNTGCVFSRSLLLLSDSASSESLRKLRIWLLNRV